MFCPKCGTQNTKTSKFCRECGRRIIAESEDIDARIGEGIPDPPDDAAVSDLLYATLKLYEQGKIESAFAKCKIALRMNPDSPSGHSLLGLIYEKKAEIQLEKGFREDAEDYLHAAIRQVERVLDANPDSIADREKLDELHDKLDSFREAHEVNRKPIGARMLIALGRIPPAWVASVSVVLVIFILLAFVFGRGNAESRDESKSKETKLARSENQVPQTGQQLPPTAYTPAAPAWTYQPQQTQPTQPQAYSQIPQGSYQPAAPSTQNQALPSLDPYPIRQPETPVTTTKPTKPEQPAVPERKPSENARAAYMRGDYASAASYYEEAISSGEDTGENQQKLGMCLYNLNKRDEAIGHFQKAVQLYMAQKSAGINVDAADKAIDTCKLYIDYLSRR